MGNSHSQYSELRQLAETTVEDVGILSYGLPLMFFAQWESGKRASTQLHAWILYICPHKQILYDLHVPNVSMFLDSLM